MSTYSAPMNALTVSTATDLFEFTVAASARVKIYMMELGQHTDLGDAAEEVLRIGLYRGATAGSTGTALTEQPYGDSNDGAATAAVVANRGTASTGGTLLEILTWNIRIPTQWIWIPELRPVFELSTVGTFRLLAAPTDAIDMSGTLVWEEL